MRRTLVTLAVTLYCADLTSSAYAHHSHPLVYDWCKTRTIEGKVEKVERSGPLTGRRLGA